MAQIVTSENFKDSIKKGVVIVEFYSTSCAPCKMLAPIFEQAEVEMQGKVKFIKVDTQVCLEIAQHYNVAMLPTLLVFKEGQKVDLMVGIAPKEKIITRLQAQL